jgi:hypothetical protein
MSVHLSTLTRLLCSVAVEYKEGHLHAMASLRGVRPQSCEGMTLGCLAMTSVLRKLLVQHSVNLTGTHDEAVRRRTYIVKRKTGEQGQVVTRR